MNDEPELPPEEPSAPTRTQQLTRKLNLPSRVRKSMREALDRVLAADVVWSAAFVIVVVALLSGQSCGQQYEAYEVGQVAPHDVRAFEDFDIDDPVRTDELRREAQDRILDVYMYDVESGSRLAGDLSELFDLGRQNLEEAFLNQTDPEQAVGALLGERISTEGRRVLVSRRFDAELEREATSVLNFVLAGKVVGNRVALEGTPAITLLYVPGERRQTVHAFDDFLDLEQARERVRQTLAERLALPRAQEQALGEFVASFVDANVYFEPVVTHRERRAAASTVRPVVRRVARGEFLAREGERLSQATVATIEAARAASTKELGPEGLLGLLFLASMLAFFLYRYTRYHQRAYRKLRHLHALIVLMVLSMLTLSGAILWLARKVSDNLSYPFNQFDYYTYLIPLGAGAILVALLSNGRIATVYSSFAALLFGAANDWDSHLMVWAMLVQCAGVYAISTYRERAALLRAGLVVGGAGAVSALTLETLKGSLEPLSGSLYGAALAFIGGAVGVGLLISFTLPMLERLFNVLTDIRLLELSNINNPLLSEFAVKAPGSYNHSLVVGNLAEVAAKAIGANSLFCRVAAFYHDIGKMNKAEYYVENQRGNNPHDRLSPSMSALIIASHVKDGLKMAREAGLPEQIADIIPQHHGTKLMTYFYEKAKSSAAPSLGPVKEEDFRYPGPKPQTREAAIFMLADAVEAAARTIDDPTPNRLNEMIRKVTNAIVVDGELDSCHLTFADLEKIQAAFLRFLVSMYHHRVDYPGFDFGNKGEGDGKAGGDSASEAKPPSELRDRRAARGS